jgi:hypothetical protein
MKTHLAAAAILLTVPASGFAQTAFFCGGADTSGHCSIRRSAADPRQFLPPIRYDDRSVDDHAVDRTRTASTGQHGGQSRSSGGGFSDNVIGSGTTIRGQQLASPATNGVGNTSSLPVPAAP